MTIYFDMDGTIVDLYSVPNWLPMLSAENATPYRTARPMCDMAELCKLLTELQAKGHKIGIISWLSKDSTQEYKRAVRAAKMSWLNMHLPIVFDELHFVQYGTRKDYVAKDKNGILFDDSAEVRKYWRGISCDPAEFDIITILRSFI